MVTWDIRREGRAWGSEAMSRYASRCSRCSWKTSAPTRRFALVIPRSGAQRSPRCKFLHFRSAAVQFRTTVIGEEPPFSPRRFTRKRRPSADTA